MLDDDVDARLKDQLGTQVGGRIFPVLYETASPLDVPCIVYATTLGESEWGCDGPTNIFRYSLDVFCTARTFPVATRLRTNTVLALDGWQQGAVMQCRHLSSEVNPTEPHGYQWTCRFEGWTRLEVCVLLDEDDEPIVTEAGFNIEVPCQT